MALAHQYQYMKVQIGTVDFTSYLANTEQTASIPAGSEVGRATLTFRDDGSMPAIPKWGTVVISSGTASPGTPVWGGYATRQSSEPASMHGGTVRMVTVDCQSYAIALSTTPPITETYGGGNNDSILQDSAIVTDLVSTYLPAFFDAGSISSANPVQCDYIQFSDETLRSSLNKVVERSAKEYGITAGADFYYRPTGSSGTLEIQLSDEPDDDIKFPMQAKPYSDRDDVEVRNAVRVVGGWTLSAVQDETFTTDGIAYSFVVNYFPQDIIRVRLANIVLSVGVYLVDPPADFDVLVHYDQRKFIFQLPPSAGKTLEIEYRYPVRVEEDVIDAASVAEVGGTIWGPTIQDSSISQAAVAQIVGSAYLARSTASIERGQLTTSWVGTATPYLPGQIIQVTAQALDWYRNEMEIQAVTMRFAPRPGGTGVCLTYWDLDVGTPMTLGRSIGEAFLDAPELRMKTFAPDIRGAITAGDVPTLDHGTALTGLSDDDHPQYLLATGSRTGASSQAQTFTNGIIGPSWKPAGNSMTALQMQQADGTAILTVDTTNKRLGINCTPSTGMLEIRGITAGSADRLLVFQDENSNDRLILYSTGVAQFEAVPSTAVMTTRDSSQFLLYRTWWNGSASVREPFGIYQMSLNAWAGRGVLQFVNKNYGFPFSISNGTYGQVAVNYAYPADELISLGQFIVRPYDAATVGQSIWMQASQTANAFQTTDSSGTPRTQILASGKIATSLENSTTNAVDEVLRLSHNSTGTPTTYFGSGIAINLQSSTTADQPAATLNTYWADATHATRSAAVAVNTVYQGTFVQVAKFGGTTGNVFNGDLTAWCDFRVAGDTATNLFFVDASADMVGIGTNTPTSRLHIQQTDSATNVVSNLLTIEHNSSGTAAAGLGAGLLFALESTSTDGQAAALLDGSWSEATHASRKGQARLWAYDDSAARLGLTIGTNGSAALVGLYAATPVAQATTSGAAASFTANSGTTVNDASTFDGYTMKQVVKALRNLGVLA